MEAAIKRILPHSTEAEQAVVGAMLMDKDAIMVAAEMLTGEDFYQSAYGMLFDAMVELFQAGKPVDLITLQEHLKEKNAPPEISGLEFARELLVNAQTSANIKYYAEIVREKATLRKMIKINEEIANNCYLENQPLDVIMDAAEKRIFELAQHGNSQEYTPIKQVVLNALEVIEKASKTKGTVTGIPTGFIDLDYKLSGLQRSDLILVAARPSMGKTAFVLNIAQYVAFKKNRSVAIFSLEMSKEQLERVMEDFSAGELDVLVATTIIESGIDNPHTNTLIIEDSQRYGLAQMYQLKGRVGRSCTQAYAYFMFPEHMELTEEAAARLTALNEHTDLGSGMRIAIRDLEIRGAGSLLGAEQSGNMSAVGFDLFAQMLNQAVSATREGDLKAMDALPPALSDITVNVPGHTYLPEEYVPDADERVLWYRRIASAATEQAVEDVRADLADKRPDMPQAAKNLLEKARIKAYANEHHIKTVSVTAGKLVVEPIDVPRDKMTGLRRAGGRYLADKRKLSLPLRYFKLDEGDNLLAPVAEFLEELAK